MRASTMITTLQWLGVVPSFSRPRVSDDNPYSEALFAFYDGIAKHFGDIGLCDDSATPRNTSTVDWLPLDIGGRRQTRYVPDCGIHYMRSGSLRKFWDLRK